MNKGYQVGGGVTNSSPTIDELIDVFSGKTRQNIEPKEVIPLAGDGSMRSYYRVICKNSDSMVLQTNRGVEEKFMRFIQAQEFYQAQALPVPAILGYSEEKSWALIEDLGTGDLQSEFRSDFLKDVLKKTASFASKKITNAFLKTELAKQSLDNERFSFEMNFFVKHFIEGLVDSSGREETVAALSKLATEAATGPYVFAHRDLQSRNIMSSGDGTWSYIDFQDSQMGPLLYDAVSLCWDPYFSLPNTKREEAFSFFVSELKKHDLSDEVNTFLSSESLELSKYLLITERFIKAAGSFASFKTLRGKDSHLIYLEGAFKVAEYALSKLKNMDSSYDALSLRCADWAAISSEKGWSGGLS